MAGFKGGFGGGNMQAMMKQAQMMQQKLADAQKELEEMEIEGESGGGMVKVVCNGKRLFPQSLSTPRRLIPTTWKCSKTSLWRQSTTRIPSPTRSTRTKWVCSGA